MNERLDHDYTDHDLLLILSERMRGVQDSVANLTVAFKSRKGELTRAAAARVETHLAVSTGPEAGDVQY